MRCLVLVALALLLAGCETAPLPPAAEGTPTVPRFESALAIPQPCRVLREVQCFEASVASDPDGRIFTANTGCKGIARSTDEGVTFQALPVPPPTREMVGDSLLGDCTLQVDQQGRLWFSALAREAGSYAMTGLQVARSDDGGETWPANRFFAAALPPPHVPRYPTDLPLATNADRQWLAFAADGRVWLAYWDWQAGRTFLSHSEDAGLTWASMAPMPGYLAGPLLAGRDGMLHSPSQDFGDPYTILDTRSTDGESFDQVEVFTAASGRTWATYPTMAETADGTLFAVWQDEAQQVLVASSNDAGATWTAPVRWNLEGARLTPGQRTEDDSPCPKVGVAGDALAVMWYEQDGDRQMVQVAWAPLEAVESGPAARTTVASYQAARQTTDFADFSVLPDGRLAVGFTEPDTGLKVAVASQVWTA